MNFVLLHLTGSAHSEIWINMDRIEAMQWNDDQEATRLYVPGTTEIGYLVIEKPLEILAKTNQS